MRRYNGDPPSRLRFGIDLVGGRESLPAAGDVVSLEKDRDV